MSEKLDKLFKDRFEHFEMPPPAGAWGQINAQLPPPPPSVWWWPLRISLAVLLVAFMFPFPVNETKQESPFTISDLTETKGEEAQLAAMLPSEMEKAETPISTTEAKIAVPANSDPVPSEIETEKAASEPKTKVPQAELNTVKGKPAISLATALFEKEKEEKPAAPQPESEPAGNTPVGLALSAEMGDPLGEEVLLTEDEEQAEEKKPEELFADPLSPFWLTYEIGKGNIISKAADLIGARKIENDFSWQFGASGGVYSSFVNIAPNPNDETVIAKPTDSGFDTDRIGWELGLNAYKPLNHKWRLGISANWQLLRLGNSFDHHSVKADDITIELYDGHNGSLKTQNTVHQTYVSVQYQMVSTQVGMTYWWGNAAKKRGVEVALGVSYAYSQAFRIGKDASRQTEGISEFLPTVSFGLPMQQPSGNSKMEFSPFVRYQLKAVNHPTGLFEWTPYTVGIRLGWLK